MVEHSPKILAREDPPPKKKKQKKPTIITIITTICIYTITTIRIL